MSHRFMNDGQSAIQIGLDFVCVCGIRGTHAEVAWHIAEAAPVETSTAEPQSQGNSMNTKQQKALAFEAFKAAWQSQWTGEISAEAAFEMWWAGRQTRKASTSAKRG
jgi:hypothetical protein